MKYILICCLLLGGKAMGQMRMLSPETSITFTINDQEHRYVDNVNVTIIGTKRNFFTPTPYIDFLAQGDTSFTIIDVHEMITLDFTKAGYEHVTVLCSPGCHLHIKMKKELQHPNIFKTYFDGCPECRIKH